MLHHTLRGSFHPCIRLLQWKLFVLPRALVVSDMQVSSDEEGGYASIPLTDSVFAEQLRNEDSIRSDDIDDLDVNGLVSSQNCQPHLSNQSSAETEEDLWQQINVYFAQYWRRIPASWSLERDPSVAFRNVLALLGFLSLCVFVFSVPSLLYVISPVAPTPPGTSPNLDEAASSISGLNGAVAADVPECSELGVKVLNELSGNAVDAMVSTVLCQGVLAPFASGIGGGALILLHMKRSPGSLGSTHFYDARETAPSASTMKAFSDNATTARFGGMAVAIPGELRGLYRAHADWGLLHWREVVRPVIKLAQNAKVGKYLAIQLKNMNSTIFSSPGLMDIFTKQILTDKGKSQQDAAAAAELPGVGRYLSDHPLNSIKSVADSLQDGSVITGADNKDEHGVSPGNTDSLQNGSYTTVLLEEGDSFINKALISTLRAVAANGPDAFYVNMSEAIAAEIRKAGGIATAKDFHAYAIQQHVPIESVYQGFTVLGAPIPSIGGVSIAMALNMITELQFRKKGRNNVSYHMLTECLKWVFGAAMGLGDPAFVPSASFQMQRMLLRKEAMRRAYRIDVHQTFRPQRYAPRISTSLLEGGTSHVSIVDRNGSAVSVTSSINLPFGAGLVSDSTGVILNDQMDAFTTSNTRVNAFGMYPTDENAVQPGKRAITSMCPTIVMRGKNVYLVLGGSGGPKAISGVLQTLLNVIDFGDSLADAISAPRLHHQLVPNVVSLEAANTSTCEETNALRRPSAGQTSQVEKGWVYWESVCEGLKTAGHKLEGPAVHGAVQAVLVPSALDSNAGSENMKIFAASDPRRIGKAAAY